MGKQGQQGEQLAVLAKVTVFFRPEVHESVGEQLEFTQVGVTQQGPFMKFVPGPGSNLAGRHEMYHFDVIAGLKLETGQIQVASDLPPAQAN